MPVFQASPGTDLHYELDDFTDPWRQPATVLMLHGNAESGQAWYGWVPVLARHLRVVRPDMRGFGRSTPMPRDHPWSLDGLIDDLCGLMDHLGTPRVHVVGAKLGGTLARAFAARCPGRVATLAVVGTPAPLRVGVAERNPQLLRDLEAHGVEHWARQAMGSRMGSDFPAEGAAWWTRFMGRTALSTQLGFVEHISAADIRDDLPRIACPTLVVPTERSALGTVEQTREWQARIPDSELQVLPGDSYHVAATHAGRCAEAVLDFIRRRGEAES
jgi:pimeloyl-ACP methyl ester carboxylesterase